MSACIFLLRSSRLSPLSRRPLDSLNNPSASAPLTHVMPGLSLVAHVDNLANWDYQLIRNYATAGRTAYLGLKWAPKL